ncbi:MAG: porin [Bacteroidota bacterium]
MRYSVAAALAWCLLLLPGEAGALPRFAARTGARCQSCHVNPAGGGMRQAFGVQYGREELPLPALSEEFSLEEFLTEITASIFVGADMRTLYYHQQVPDTGAGGGPDRNAFWQMQGDIYLNFRLARKVSLYLDKGLYDGFEVFGLAQVLPAGGFLKVGKFVPAYGMRMDDHRIFTRDATGFSPEQRPELTGMEAGVSPGPVALTAGIFNSRDGFGQGSTKAFLGRLEASLQGGEDFFVGLGGSAFTRKQGSERTTLYGGFGSVGYGPFTLLGEGTFIRSERDGAAVTGLAAFAEAGYAVHPGVEIKFLYDFLDRDLDLKSGSASRYGIGAEFFPISGVEVRPLYRIAAEDPVSVRNDEFNLMIHFYL